MNSRRVAMSAAAAIATGLVGWAPLVAQNPPARVLQEQQMLRLQEQATQLNAAMGQMARIRERAQLLERQLTQEMTRLQGLEEAQQSVRLESQERLRAMAQALGEGAGEVHRAMEQFRSMIGEPMQGWNEDAERDLVRLRASWEETARTMEEGLTIMERLRERLREPDGPRS